MNIMNNKYLPIGSVCNINNDSELLMIVGFKKNGKDYEGLHFPEGTNSTKENVYFNHDEINELYALGYKNADSKSFSKELLDGSNTYTFTVETSSSNASIVDKYFFDENGVIVSDNSVQTKSEENNSIFNKYEFDENGVIISDNSISSNTEENNDNIFNKYVFDENGVVIAENRPAVEPTKVEDIPTFGEIEFDSNGVVVSSNDKKPTSRFEFDENGIIVAEHKEG